MRSKSESSATKPARNDPCPCGSGKKYKKCHGGIEHLDRIARLMTAVPGLRARHEAKEHQRIEQRPPLGVTARASVADAPMKKATSVVF